MLKNEDSVVRVVSYPDYKETEIYIKLIEQLKKAGASYREIDLSKFGSVNISSYIKETGDSGNVISVGGDGTALKGMFMSYISETVFLPLGLGEIGYLVNSDKRKYTKLIKQVIDNKFDSTIISSRAVISCSTVDPEWPVFNEIAITKSGSNTLLEFNIKVNKETIDLKADGIVISTSGGSTAYSYSAGGPIVDPSLDSVVITPIAPFSKFPRSIVLPSSALIKIGIGTPKYYKSIGEAKYDIFFDGVVVNELLKIKDSNETLLDIKQNDRKVNILGVSNEVNISEFLSQILR